MERGASLGHLRGAHARVVLIVDAWPPWIVCCLLHCVVDVVAPSSCTKYYSLCTCLN